MLNTRFGHHAHCWLDNTDFVDNFTRADGNIGTNAPWSYTEARGGTGAINTDFQIASNLCHRANTGGSTGYIRAEQVMASTDHHASVTMGATTTPGAAANVIVGVQVRMDVSALTWYEWIWSASSTPNHGTLQLFRRVADTTTNLTSTFSQDLNVGDVLKLSAVGTTITGTYNGSQIAQVTDSNITTGVRAGFALLRQSGGEIQLSELRFNLGA